MSIERREPKYSLLQRGGFRPLGWLVVALFVVEVVILWRLL